MLQFYIGTHPKPALNETSVDEQVSSVSETDSSSLCDGLSPESTLEKPGEQYETDSFQAFLPEVFIVSDHIDATQSSVNTEHPTSTYVRIITDSIYLSVAVEHAIEETISDTVVSDNSDPEITFGAQRVIDVDSLSETLIYEPDELPQIVPPALLRKTLLIHYSNSFNDIIDAVSDPEIMK